VKQTKHCVILNSGIFIPYVLHNEVFSTQAREWAAANPHIDKIQYMIYRPRLSIIRKKTTQKMIKLIQIESPAILKAWNDYEANNFLMSCDAHYPESVSFERWAKLWSRTTKQNTPFTHLLLNKVKLKEREEEAEG
jgi:hypothetical protein